MGGGEGGGLIGKMTERIMHLFCTKNSIYTFRAYKYF